MNDDVFLAKVEAAHILAEEIKLRKATEKLLIEARAKIETYKGIIRDYRRMELEKNPTPPPGVPNGD
jgi:hypothetical protein